MRREKAVKVSTGNLVRPWSRVIWQARLGIHFTKKGRKQGKGEREEMGGAGGKKKKGQKASKQEIMNLNSNNCTVIQLADVSFSQSLLME